MTEFDRLATSLAHSGGKLADAPQIAQTVADAYAAINVSLAPIIGRSGVAALSKRSVHLACRRCPWLRPVLESVQIDFDPVALASRLAAQSSANAAAGGAACLQSFYELLSSLVGPSLTERLLRKVWIQFSSAPPSQDIQS